MDLCECTRPPHNNLATKIDLLGHCIAGESTNQTGTPHAAEEAVGADAVVQEHLPEPTT